MSLFVGIDPGKSGGIALIDSEDGTVTTWKMPGTEQDVLDVLKDCLVQGAVFCALEKVGPMPMPGKKCPLCKKKPSQGVGSTFKFGVGYGGLRMACTAAGLRWDAVAATKWCAEVGLHRKKGESTTDWKNRHKALAQQLFPKAKKITHAVADALLLAEYARRTA